MRNFVFEIICMFQVLALQQVHAFRLEVEQ